MQVASPSASSRSHLSALSPSGVFLSPLGPLSRLNGSGALQTVLPTTVPHVLSLQVSTPELVGQDSRMESPSSSESDGLQRSSFRHMHGLSCTPPDSVSHHRASDRAARSRMFATWILARPDDASALSPRSSSAASSVSAPHTRMFAARQTLQSMTPLPVQMDVELEVKLKIEEAESAAKRKNLAHEHEMRRQLKALEEKKQQQRQKRQTNLSMPLAASHALGDNVNPISASPELPLQKETDVEEGVPTSISPVGGSTGAAGEIASTTRASPARFRGAPLLLPLRIAPPRIEEVTRDALSTDAPKPTLHSSIVLPTPLQRSSLPPVSSRPLLPPVLPAVALPGSVSRPVPTFKTLLNSSTLSSSSETPFDRSEVAPAVGSVDPCALMTMMNPTMPQSMPSAATRLLTPMIMLPSLLPVVMAPSVVPPAILSSDVSSIA
jgi:hypothetical protein